MTITTYITAARDCAARDDFDGALAALNRGYLRAGESEVRELDRVRRGLQERRRARAREVEAAVRAALAADLPDLAQADERLALLERLGADVGVLAGLNDERERKAREGRTRKVLDEARELLEESRRSVSAIRWSQVVYAIRGLVAQHPGVAALEDLARQAEEERERVSETVEQTGFTAGTVGDFKKAEVILKRAITEGTTELPWFDWGTDAEGNRTLVEARYDERQAALDHFYQLAREYGEGKTHEYLAQARANLPQAPHAARDWLQKALAFTYIGDDKRRDLQTYLAAEVAPAVQRREAVEGRLKRLPLRDPRRAWKEIAEAEAEDPHAPGIGNARSKVRPRLAQALEEALRGEEQQRLAGETQRPQQVAAEVKALVGGDAGLEGIVRLAEGLIQRCLADEALSRRAKDDRATIEGLIGAGRLPEAEAALEALDTEIQRHAQEQRQAGVEPRLAGQEDARRLRSQLAAKRGLAAYLLELDHQLHQAQTDEEFDSLDAKCKQPPPGFENAPELKAFLQRVGVRRHFVSGLTALEALRYGQAANDLSYVVQNAGPEDADIRQEAQEKLQAFQLSPQDEIKVQQALRDALLKLGRKPALDWEPGVLPPPTGGRRNPDYRQALRILIPWKEKYTSRREQVIALCEHIAEAWEVEVVRELEAIESETAPRAYLHAEGLILEILEKTLLSPAAQEWRVRLLPRIYEAFAQNSDQDGNYATAMESWQQAIEVAPDARPYRRGKRETHKRWVAQETAQLENRGELEKVIDQWIALTIEYPEDPEVRFRLAKAYHLQAQRVLAQPEEGTGDLARRATESMKRALGYLKSADAVLKQAEDLIDEMLVHPGQDPEPSADEVRKRKHDADVWEYQKAKEERERWQPLVTGLHREVLDDQDELKLRQRIADDLDPAKGVTEIRDAQITFDQDLLPRIRQRHADSPDHILRLDEVDRWHHDLVNGAVRQLLQQLEALQPPGDQGWDIAWDISTAPLPRLRELGKEVRVFEERWRLAAKICALHPGPDSIVRTPLDEPRNAFSHLKRNAEHLLQDFEGPRVIEQDADGRDVEQDLLSIERQYDHAQVLVLRLGAIRDALAQYASADPDGQKDPVLLDDVKGRLNDAQARMNVLYRIKGQAQSIANRLLAEQDQAGREMLDKWLPLVRERFVGPVAGPAGEGVNRPSDSPQKISDCIGEWFVQWYEGGDKRLSHRWEGLEVALTEACRLDPQNKNDTTFNKHRTLRYLRDRVQEAQAMHRRLAMATGELVGNAWAENFDRARELLQEIEKTDPHDEFRLRAKIAILDPKSGEEIRQWTNIAEALRLRAEQLQKLTQWSVQARAVVDWEGKARPEINGLLAQGRFDEARSKVMDALDGGLGQGNCNEFRGWSLKKARHHLDSPPGGADPGWPLSLKAKDLLAEVETKHHDLKENIKVGEGLLQSTERVRQALRGLSAGLENLAKNWLLMTTREALAPVLQATLEQLGSSDDRLGSPDKARAELGRAIQSVKNLIDNLPLDESLPESVFRAKARLLDALEDAELLAMALESSQPGCQSIAERRARLDVRRATVQAYLDQINERRGSRLAWRRQANDRRIEACRAVLAGFREVAPEWVGWREFLMQITAGWSRWEEFKDQAARELPGWSELMAQVKL